MRYGYPHGLGTESTTSRHRQQHYLAIVWHHHRMANIILPPKSTCHQMVTTNIPVTLRLVHPCFTFARWILYRTIHGMRCWSFQRLYSNSLASRHNSGLIFATSTKQSGTYVKIEESMTTWEPRWNHIPSVLNGLFCCVVAFATTKLPKDEKRDIHKSDI